MSGTSVRSVLAAAAADGKISLAEAELASFVALRTNGIDDDERKQINGVLAADLQFEPGAKEHLEANGAEPEKKAGAYQGIHQLVDARGLDVLELGKRADSSKFSDGLKAGLQKFSELVGNSDGESLGQSALQLRAGGEDVFLVTDYDGNCEVVGLFDKEGKEVGRTAIIDDDRETLGMRWVNPTGFPGAPIGTPTEHGFDVLPYGFKETLEKYVAEKGETGDGYGKDIAAEELPPVLRRRYKMMERTIADGTGLEKANVEGVTVYVLRDFSCVSSSHFFTENGKRLMTIEG